MAVFAGGCTFADVEAVCAGAGELLDELESLVDKALVQMDAQADRLRMLQTIARVRPRAARGRRRGARHRAQARPPVRGGAPARSATASRATEQLAASSAGSREEDNLQAALDTLLAAARAATPTPCELGLQMSGDLWMYWHIRGKNVTARDYAVRSSPPTASRTPTAGRAARLAHGRTRLLDDRQDRARRRGMGEAYARRGRRRRGSAKPASPPSA